MPDFELNRPIVPEASECTDPVQFMQAISTIVKILGDPGPPGGPDDPDSPCGELVGIAYVKDVDGTPSLVFVDENGNCVTIDTGGGSGVMPNIVYGVVENPDIGGNQFRVTKTANITGSELGTLLTFLNVHGDTYSIGDPVFGVESTSTGLYIPDRDRSSSSTMVVCTILAETSADPVDVLQADYRPVFGSETRPTIQIANTQGETFAANAKIPCWKRDSDGLYEPDRFGTGAGGPAPDWTMLHVTFNGDESTDPFTISNTEYEVVFGSEDRSTVTVQNSFGESFTTGEKITVFKRNDGTYEPDRAGSGPFYSMVVITPAAEQSGGSFIVGDTQYSVVFGNEDRNSITVDNIFNETFPAGVKFTAFRNSVGEYVPDRGGEGSDVTMVYGTIPSNTSAATFNVTTYSVIFGSEDRDFITVDNRIGEEFISGDQVPLWRVTNTGQYVCDRKGAGTATMVIATVPANTSTGFSTSVFELVFGEETENTITVNNTYSENFEQGDRVPCWKRDDNGTYEPDRSGEGKGVAIGSADQSFDIGDSGNVSIGAETLAVVNRSDRPIFRNSMVVVDRRADIIISSDSPVALVANATGNAPTTTSNFNTWAGLTHKTSLNASDFTEASPSISDIFDCLQFVRSGDSVGFLLRSGFNLVPMQVDLLSRHYEKLSWICGLGDASGSDTLLKVLGKPETPSGDLCDPKWFDPPTGGKEDQYYRDLFNGWIADWLSTNGQTRSFVESIDSVVPTLETGLGATGTEGLLRIRINFKVMTGAIITPTAGVATNVQGTLATEEACPLDPA